MPSDQDLTPESRAPQLGELLLRLGDRISKGLRVALPARVISYDSAKHTVDVQPLLKEVVDQSAAKPVAVSLPVVFNVPVMHPSGGGFRLLFPLETGDQVLLVFADRSLDRWKSAGAEVDPQDLRRHKISEIGRASCRERV